MHHRYKHRLLTTLITLIIFVLCIDIFLSLGNLSLEYKLLLTFTISIFLITIYHIYGYRHCHEYITMINNLTQIYFGTILLISIILMIILKLIFNIKIINSYLVLSAIVIIITFTTLGVFDRFLENHTKKKFSMKVPTPKRK